MPSPRRPRWRVFAPLALSTLALAACGPFDEKAPQSTLYPDGPQTRSIHSIAKPVYLIAVGIGVFVYALVAYCIVKFRRKGDDDVPVQVHGNTAMEIGWTIAPAMLLAVVGVFSVGKIFQIAEEPKDAYNIIVVGHQWWWEYRYPTPGQSTLTPRLVTAEDPMEKGRLVANVLEQPEKVVVTANELHVPAGKTVRLIITSQDVMHNYWVPKLAGKIYAIPGKLNRLTLRTDADDAGKLIYGQCAEFCGTSHANMRFKVQVDSPADFDAWLANQAGPVVKATGDPNTDLVAAGEAIFNGSGGCTACHWVESDKVNDAAKIGPNLTHVGSRKHFAGAIAELDARNLKAWLRNPQEFKPGSKMVIRKLKEDEVTKLVAYIQSLK